METKIINNRPVMIWASSVDAKAMQQIENLTTLPFLFHHLAIMPDVHAGMGMPIGGVLACNTPISRQWHTVKQLYVAFRSSFCLLV